MKAHTIQMLLFVALAAIASGQAAAQIPLDLSRWVDGHEVTEPSLQKALLRECALVRAEAITKNPGYPLTYNIATEPFVIQRDGAGGAFCPTMRFYGQPRVASQFAGRSGVLVGPDLVLTAAHNIPNDLAFVQANFRFVFDFRYKDGFNGIIPPQTQGISREKVYSAVEIVAHGPTIGNEPPGGFKLDFLLIRLDRPVSGERGFMRVRRGQVPAAIGDRTVTIGHTDALPAKVALDGRIGELNPGNGINPYGTITLYNAPAPFGGASGSMFYNVSKDVIESVVTFGGCMYMAFYAEAGCVDFANGCGLAGEPISTGTQIQFFSQFVPAHELVVSPLLPVHHTSVAGTAFSETSTVSVDLSSVASGSTPVVLENMNVMSDSRVSPQISLQFVPPAGGEGGQSVGPGQRGEIRVTATVAPSVPPGEYTVNFVVGDGRWGFRDTITHTFSVVSVPVKK